MMNCPLCGAASCSGHVRKSGRSFVRCDVCHLVFVPQEFHLSPKQERARYDLHRNEPGNPEYASYLSSIADDVLRFAPKGEVKILDFGSGGGRVLWAFLHHEAFTALPMTRCTV